MALAYHSLCTIGNRFTLPAVCLMLPAMTALLDAPPVSSSLTGKRWELRGCADGQARELAQSLDIPDILARFLLGRGVSPDEAHGFLHPSLKASLPDPSHLRDMDAGAERLAQAVIAGEIIGIFGDYDVDGATSSALLARFFALLGARTLTHIPDRMKEGYGPNAPALRSLKERGAAVVITVDCGTLAFDALEEAHAAGLDVIVADHHQGEARRPKALAIINPNRLDETSPHKNLAAVGVCFLLAVAVTRALRRAGWFNARPEPDLLSLLDLAALGTICDVVPLTGANRALVAQGLKILAARRNTGLRVLMDVARLGEPPGTYACGFVLGPRINAGGRVGKSEFGARLLSCDDETEALTLARALDLHNEERKAIEALVMEQAMAMAEAQAADMPVILVSGAGWHPGVIGIVAGRIKERHGKPVAVVALEGGVGKASARSVGGFDFGANVIAALEAGLLVAGGGHAMAAGFTVEEDKLAALHAFLIQRCTGLRAERTLKLDACVALSGLNVALAHALEQAGPYGSGHPQPRLCVLGAQVAHATVVGGKHVRLILTDESRTRLPALAFRSVDTPFGQALLKLPGKRIHAAGTLKCSFWQGREEAAFTLEDVGMAS